MMIRSSFQAPIALTLALALPTTAFAQVPPPPTESAPAQPAEETKAPEAKPTEDYSGLNEEQKQERARDLYMAAEELVANGDYTNAVPKYEQAYYLVPGKHGFAYKVGIASYSATPRDCDKSDEYLKHYIKYEDPEKHPDWIDEAKRIIGEIAVSGCKTQPAAATTTATDPGPTLAETGPVGGEGPEFISESDRRARAAEDEERERDAGRKSGMFKGGVALIAIGGAASIGGVVTMVLARKDAASLTDKTSSSTANSSTGFPSGDYDCRNPDEQGCAPDLEKSLALKNGLTVGLLAGGGALLATGVALVVVDAVKNKKEKNAMVAPMFLPGGGGAAAAVRF